MQSRSEQAGFVKNSNDVEELEMDGGARIRWLITVDKGKSTPTHSHDYEHEIFVIEGKLSVQIGHLNQDAPAGAYIYIPPNEIHGMRAMEDSRIICIVPIKAARLALGE